MKNYHGFASKNHEVYIPIAHINSLTNALVYCC